MKKLAFWSRQNKGKARFVIAVSHIVLGLLGIATGIYSYLENIRITGGFLFLLAGIFSITYLLYPEKGIKSGIFKYSFTRRFRHDFVLVLSSTCIIVAGVNNFAYQPLNSTVSTLPASLMVAKSSAIELPLSKKEMIKGFAKRIKQVRTSIKEKLKAMKANRMENDGNKTGLKVLLILLTVLMAAGLFYLVSSLSCNLSCAGHEGAAWMVLIGGTAGIVWLSVVLIGVILRNGKTKKEHKTEKVPLPDPG